MPERIKLTEKVLREAEPVVGRDYQIFDSEVRGLPPASIVAAVGLSPSIIAMPGGSAG